MAAEPADRRPIGRLGTMVDMSSNEVGHGAVDTLTGVIVDAFTEVFGAREPISADSDFFEIGGDSILAARVVARLRRQLGIAVTMRDMFSARTVGALAETLRRTKSLSRSATVCYRAGWR